MKKKAMTTLVVLNVLLAVGLLAGPAISQLLPLDYRDCCQAGVMESSREYCCIECCFFFNDCENDEDCVETTRG